ncbi:putative ribosome-binding protein 1 isoform X7 [Apostichopus japonicus]|uniref:Putative ribosome-binding protein 1 isoform X7 n=1 Tax=Stichopus japonicus TaxID=307972 RepID=A0A2G8K2N6_STIJA|nr:putative ribosome-binding protein 1 isoform X7 [Apostichopus japonicus]
MAAMDLIEPQYLALCVFAGFVGLSALIYAIASFGMKRRPRESYRRTAGSIEQGVSAAAGNQTAAPPSVREPPQEGQGEARQVTTPVESTSGSTAGKPRGRKGILRGRGSTHPTPDCHPRQEKKKEKPAPVVQKVAEKPKPVEPEVIKPKKVKKTEAALSFSTPPVIETVTKIVEEPIMAQRNEQVQAAAPPPTQQEEKTTPAKSKKAKQALGPSGDNTDAPIKGKALVNAVRNAQLKPNEIQQMMEILIGKGGGSPDDWVMTGANQRTDPSSGLKKQLQEKEQALHKEMLLSQSNMQKLKEAKAELVQERSHTKELESQYKTKVDLQVQDIDALRRRMQQTHEQHSMETQALQATIKQMQAVMDESNMESVKQLREENNRLKTETNHAQQQKEQIMGAELARLQGEIQKMQSQVAASDSQLRKTNEMRHDYETRIQSYEAKIAQMESNTRESSSSLTKRLTEMTEELRKAEAQKRSMGTELEKSQEGMRTVSEELNQARQQLQGLSKSDDEKKTMMAKFEEKEKDAEYQRQGLETKVRAIESQLKDNEKTKEEMAQEIKNLKLEKANLENQVATTEQRPEAEGQEEPAKANGDINAKDTISLTEHEAILKEKQDSIDKLQLQMNASSTEVKTLNEQIEQQKKKNNDELSQKLLEEERQSKDVVQRLFPSIEANKALAHKEWLKDFEQKALLVLQEKEGPNQESEELNSQISSLEADCEKYSLNIESLEMEKVELAKTVAELQNEKKQLASQCDHYQSVLGDTEGMLNKLQSSVELEEQKWEEKLASTEKLLQQAKAEVVTLQSELTSLKTKQQDTSDYQKVVADLASSKSTIEQLQKDRESVAGELDDVKKQLNQLKNELGAANQRAESNSAGPEMEQLKQNVASANTENQRLSTDLETASTTIKDLKSQLENKGSSQDLQKELTATKDALEQTKKQSSTEKQLLETQIEKLKKSLQDSEGNNNSQKTTELEKELTTAKGEASKAKEELKKLTAELEKSKTQNGEPASSDSDANIKEIAALNKTLARRDD